MQKHEKINKNGLWIEEPLHDFLEMEVLPGSMVNPELFWKGFSNLIKNYSPLNKHLLKKRDYLQKEINAWHQNQIGKKINPQVYKSFLLEIGYLMSEGDDFQIETKDVDPEIGIMSGPQLVVPVTNARYTINAVNARWGSLYDAIYGSDVLDDGPVSSSYDPERGERVIAFSKSHLDQFAPLINYSWSEVSKIAVDNNSLSLFSGKTTISLLEQSQFLGYRNDQNGILSEVILTKNDLRCRIIIDRNSNIGKDDRANINDIQIEAAITTIIDCEDSVATVDTEDKVKAYRNWLGLMKGDLSTTFSKGGSIINRQLNSDIDITTSSGSKLTLKGRSLLLVRNVGHLMTTPSILDEHGDEIGEGLMDAVCTVLIAQHDIKRQSGIKNSTAGSVYIVKPKMHGPEEVKFANDVFTEIEKFLQMQPNSIKMGIMDEERRTSVNLKECIREAKSRIAFINTGFLDRTGDEIHTSMEAGPMLPKKDMKLTKWIKAYENSNVDIGLACGLQGKAQIGKGMWAMPDLMADMLEQKIDHPKSGANCAWVPSPTAAVIHALHYHLVNVTSIQSTIKNEYPRTSLKDLLDIPLLMDRALTEEEINNEIRNNAQGILGYVVRWVDQGIGCSKVPDIDGIGLMEDRATCRISSQALANWIRHGLASKQNVIQILEEMAILVDKQNDADDAYTPMSSNYNRKAFSAACDLIFSGLDQPSGYTEPILHAKRREQKNGKS
ncbi:malate synthase G [Alphaproteobacteria bacterium]|nr:malate synthase G [Alphaproteobacteria bacterium]|tara:strand:+ start:7526 stop:9697 length:2172 start_codon:yes stop_codon:yes gene_type:complete